jgi:hypothetical protein
MNKAQYTELMAKIADGGKVSQETHDELTAFAKKAKVKRPPADAVIDTAAIKEAATTAKGTPDEKPAKAKGKAKAEPKAKKEPKPKVKCSVTKEQDPKMKTKTCPEFSRAGGMCATHYSRLIYRAQPKNAEKAREASKNYAARVRAEKKAAAEAEAKADSAA